MILKGDFHTHMNGDGIAHRWRNIQNLCYQAMFLGFNSIYLGCHDYVATEFKEKVEYETGLKVLLGAEITTTAGHILAYNITHIPKDCWANNVNPVDINKALDMIHSQEGKAVIAHPYQLVNGIPKHWCHYDELVKIIDKFDGAEEANYKCFVKDGTVDFPWVRDYKHLKL